MNKHTPGPWQVSSLSQACVTNAAGMGVAEMWVRHGQEWEANARLIAAAPELLEALKAWDLWDYEVQSAKANGESVYLFQDLVDMRMKASELSYAAIAKATGAA